MPPYRVSLLPKPLIRKHIAPLFSLSVEYAIEIHVLTRGNSSVKSHFLRIHGTHHAVPSAHLSLNIIVWLALSQIWWERTKELSFEIIIDAMSAASMLDIYWSSLTASHHVYVLSFHVIKFHYRLIWVC